MEVNNKEIPPCPSEALAKEDGKGGNG